jgi:hypothetical protein
MRRADLSLLVVAAAASIAAFGRVHALMGDPAVGLDPSVAAPRAPSVPEIRSAPSVPWQRPLFSRMASPAKPADDNITTGGVAQNVALPRLIGVIINENDRMAIFIYGAKVQRVAENQEIGEWLLTSIRRREATLRRNAETIVLKLDPSTQ